MSGVKVAKRDLKVTCDVCAHSTERGWLWMRGGDWVQCPQCNGKGFINIHQVLIEPTRKIIVPRVV